MYAARSAGRMGTYIFADPVRAAVRKALEALAQCDDVSATQRKLASKEQVAHSYAKHRGRVSSTELASIVGTSYTNVGPVLKRLAKTGVLRPSSPTGRGKGFHYTYVDSDG